MDKTVRIAQEAAPVILMIVLIPYVTDDYVLSALYAVIIALSLFHRHYKLDFTALVLGFLIMTAGELLFVLTGVETFTRTSLFGLIPLWLPLLWAYGFVAIKRSIQILR